MKSDIILQKNNKILKTTKISVPIEEAGKYFIEDKITYLEKVLEIVYFNGSKNENLRIKNLGEKIGSQTKEQRVRQQIMNETGHLMIRELDNRIINIRNIIDVKEKWIPIKKV